MPTGPQLDLEVLGQARHSCSRGDTWIVLPFTSIKVMAARSLKAVSWLIFVFKTNKKNKAEGQMKEFVRTEGYLKKIILKSVTVYFLTLLNMIEFTFGASVNIMSISKLCMFLFSIRKIILIFIFLSVQNNWYIHTYI